MAEKTIKNGSAVRPQTVFVTRDPMVHQVGGSTTSALNLLEVLARQGTGVTIVSTLAFSRSPRAWLRAKVPLPAGVRLCVPGYLRLGKWYVRPFAPKPWARAACRLAARVKALWPVRWLAKACFGDGLFCEAWDLTPPTASECRAALDAIGERAATTAGVSTVIVNYAYWAPIFDQMTDRAASERGRPAPSELRTARRVILMHDLLSARVRRFLEAGEPLDCPRIEEATELAWLDRADCVLAAQAREAEHIQPLVRARVLVQPIVLRPRRTEGRIDPLRCLFVGSNILPNRAGLTFFLENVWPKIRAENSAARLAVVGTVCNTLADGLERDGVEKVGVVAAMEEEYARAAVCVVPLLIGSGIKIKLIEALSCGKAIVSTSTGIEGLEDWAAGAVDVADDADAFAAAALRLLANPDLRKKREEAALALALRHYGAEQALAPEFVEAVLGPRKD